jgi:uncharacterized Tic20 family protein
MEEEVKEQKKTVYISLPQLKGKNKYETAENYSILFILIGAVMLSVGIGLTTFNPKGIFTVVAMLGSFIAFLSTVALIFVWLVKEIFGSE